MSGSIFRATSICDPTTNIFLTRRRLAVWEIRGGGCNTACYECFSIVLYCCYRRQECFAFIVCLLVYYPISCWSIFIIFLWDNLMIKQSVRYRDTLLLPLIDYDDADDDNDYNDNNNNIRRKMLSCSLTWICLCIVHTCAICALHMSVDLVEQSVSDYWR